MQSTQIFNYNFFVIVKKNEIVQHNNFNPSKNHLLKQRIFLALAMTDRDRYETQHTHSHEKLMIISYRNI